MHGLLCFLPLWHAVLMGHRVRRQLFGAAFKFWPLHIWKARGEAAAGQLDNVACANVQWDESFVYVCLFPYFFSWVNYFFL